MKVISFLLLTLGALAFTDQMMSLEQLSKFDVSTFNCDKSPQQFIQIEHQMKMWADLLSHKNAVTHDIKVLNKVQKLLTNKSNSFLELQTNLKKSVLNLLKTLELPHLKNKIGLTQLKTLKAECKALDSENHEDREAARKELCRLLKQYVANLNNCKKQCSQAPITVIKIKGQIKDLEIIRGGCNGSANHIKVITDEKTITVDHKGNQSEVPNDA